MQSMQINCLCEIYRGNLYLIYRCLSLFSDWLSIGLTPAFSTYAILPISHFPLLHFQSPQCTIFATHEVGVVMHSVTSVGVCLFVCI